MNLYVLLVGFIAWGVSVGGAVFYGMGLGDDQCTARQARDTSVAAVATAAAASAAAHAISKIEVKHVTVRQELEREIHTNTVFRECRSGPEPVRLFNNAIPGAKPTEPAGGGKLPATNAAR